MNRFILAVIVLCAPVVAGAQPAPDAADGPKSPFEIRTYNVGDLLRPAQRGEIDLQGQSPQIAPLVDTSVLVGVIQQLIDTQSWIDNGGSIGQIQVLGPTLIIRQTPENHGEILSLLQRVRAEQGPVQQLNIRAYWLLLDGDDLKALTDAAAKSGQPVIVVPDELITDERLYSTATASTFSGRAVKLRSAREQTYISDVTPIVAQNSVGYDPQPATATSGVTLTLLPQVQQDGQILLDVQNSVSEIDDISQVTMPARVTPPATGPAEAGQVDRLNVVTQALTTSLRIPAGSRVLVGGMTLDPAAKAKPARQLFLVLRIDVAG